MTNEALAAVRAAREFGATEILVDAIEERLSFEPAVETRNRKRVEENSLEAAFELRVGALRVYYVVEEDARIVNVLAVGLKDRDRVIIGGEEIEL